MKGNFWVFSKHSMVQFERPDEQTYCDKCLFMLSFWQLIGIYVLVAVAFVLRLLSLRSCREEYAEINPINFSSSELWFIKRFSLNLWFHSIGKFKFDSFFDCLQTFLTLSGNFLSYLRFTFGKIFFGMWKVLKNIEWKSFL